MLKKVEETIQKKKEFDLYYIDLNNFKGINDTYGHAVGDRALQLFAKSVRKNMTPALFWSRLAGDEFAVIVESEALKKFESILENIRTDLRAQSIVNDKEVYVSFSVGKAHFPEDGKTPDTLFHHADNNMYMQKQNLKHKQAGIAEL